MTTHQPLWYKDAVIYQLHVKAFADSNNDGIGDFRGLTSKLDYIQDLGVTAIWLLPFYPSPMRDDGYDIADFRDINPAYGTMDDFREFVAEAHSRGLHVITELVVNHTSDQHPWFQRARRASPGSEERDYYVWSDTDKKYAGTRVIFTDTETSNWAWDAEAKAYYWHRFFSHQPDLNFDNPKVIAAVIDTMRFWLDAGVDGLRLDAVPYLCEREGTNNENLPETHAVIKNLRAAMDESHPGRMLLAEANQWPEDVLPYFGEGDGDECHMAFHFPLMPRMFMAIAQEDRLPITDIIRQTPTPPANGQWGMFLRNHDELTLEMVTDRERDYMYKFYASDPRAKINVGIRRRLAPLLHNDRRKIELLKSLLMSMPGTPILYYGDEIGMGDNIYLGDRNGVRTPMQWSPDRNGGFSRANPAQLFLPLIMDPVYGFEAVNVERQTQDPSSLLSWVRRLCAVRRGRASLGRGSVSLLYPGNRRALAYSVTFEDEVVLCVANLARSSEPVELDLSQFRGRVPIELMSRTPFPPIGELPYLLTLQPYAFFWFLLTSEAEAPEWHTELPPTLPELATLVLPQGWQSFLAGREHAKFTGEILPTYVPKQRWFGAKGRPVGSFRSYAGALLGGGDRCWLLDMIEVELADGEKQQYFLPLGIAWETKDDDGSPPYLPYALGKIRQGSRTGLLHDAYVDPGFMREVLAALREKRVIPASHGEMRFVPTERLEDIAFDGEPEVRALGVEQSNTSIIIGEKIVAKGYRRLHPGLHLELEVARYLTETAGYANTPPLIGSIEHISSDGTPTALCTLQGFVSNQGDGWRYTLNHLTRLLDRALTQEPEAEMVAVPDPGHMYRLLIETLGTRTAELHQAFALTTGDPGFDPEPVTADDLASWTAQIAAQVSETLTLLADSLHTLPDEESRGAAAALVAEREGLEALIGELVPDRLDGAKTRYHGDYHLGQVLVVRDDWMLIDFEGEPLRPLEERRAKHSPVKDVAGMLRSFNYAAWAALFKATQDRPEDVEGFQPAIEAWERDTKEAFLSGYAEAIVGCPSHPSQPEDAAALLDLFLIEKAAYEIRYELANRPAWVRIPVLGLSRILAARKA